MPNKITIKNSSFSFGEGEGVCASHDTQIEIENTIMNFGRGIAVHQRDIPSAFQAIGFPADTPPKFLIDALQILKEKRYESVEVKKKTLEKSRLFQWLLDSGADATTITWNLIQIAQKVFA